MGEFHHNLGIGKELSKCMTKSSINQKKKIEKLSYIKIKNICI